MADPNEYNASKYSTELPGLTYDPPPPKEPSVTGDPLNDFQDFHYQDQSDLRAWMTFSVKDRYKKAQKYAGTLQDIEIAGRTRIDAPRRHKILNYIIWRESIEKRGDVTVAQVAFDALFPSRNS